MTQSEFIDYVAETRGETITDVAYFLSIFLDAIIEKVASGEEVRLYGFGQFKQRHKRAYTGTNPKTQEPMEIEACSMPVFQAGAEFKRAVKVGKKPRNSGA